MSTRRLRDIDNTRAYLIYDCVTIAARPVTVFPANFPGDSVRPSERASEIFRSYEGRGEGNLNDDSVRFSFPIFSFNIPLRDLLEESGI